MVDTTTQTPRHDDVTEFAADDSRDIEGENDTTEDKEEHKEDIEGGESTKDSGIHQEDAYEESYADEDFEEDEDAQSDDEKGRLVFISLKVDG